MKKTQKEKLPESEVFVKQSVCPKCEGQVCVAVKHMMDRKSKNEFMKEVMEFNLSVKEIPLLEYRKMKIKFCLCK